ncbi:MAG: tRNA (N6-isopentenyl adenosine(37)-C2)-methylthiotransferase MiaB [Candidatus Omnitrophica bacterium CG22_combo_CG10-13_8_21_14_all_43_16]|nr:MAG: tRNA (N6-isopentenyl adenosine(37)-C2)-methylthiotransferase MiaB [Candidatus Omnitrophica bacterium CG22_combo_CG10-13_8_21_14_all_43_16]
MQLTMKQEVASKKVFIRTLGCQMNEHDSARLKDLLTERGYAVCDSPESADAVIFNTCSVRKHAEDRVYGKVGTLAKLKAKKTGLIIGIIGCMAEARRDEIFRRLPIVDFLCGPGDLDKVPDIIDKIKAGAGHIMCLEGYKSKIIPGFSKERKTGEKAYVKIMEGCDNFCSYCIVPYVRGRERSRPSKDILNEIKKLINNGVKEIILLGQNVNSYGRGLKEKIDFVGLLGKIDNLVSTSGGPGYVKVGFFTSHPKDAGPELFKAMRDLNSIIKILHLPIQSGSDKVLKRMNRKYTVAKYKKLAGDYRKIVKGGNISSDIIVGFPGERESDFKGTLNVVKELQFDAAYIFKYSPRPGTKAAKFKDDVTLEEKERRHALLLGLQRDILVSKRR